jgi:hypothetical protein
MRFVMRRMLLASVVASLALSAAVSVRADDAKELQAVIDKAIKARGGADKLAKFKAATWKGKGKFYGLGDAVEYTGEWAIFPPSRSRNTIDLDFGGMKVQRTAVVNGDKGWVKLNDMLQEMDKDQLAEVRDQLYLNTVTSLIALKDKAYQLSSLEEAKVDDRPAVGVKVSHKDRPDVSLFFDKESGLPLKSEVRLKDGMSGQEYAQEMLYGDYKEVDGLKHAMKITIKRDGKLYIEAEWSDFKQHDSLDDGLFGKP